MPQEIKKIAKNDPERLGKESIGKLILEFSIPAIITMLCNTLYNIIDTAFLQMALGDHGSAVATLAMPVMTILMGLSMLAGQGGNALAAIQMGQGEKNKVEKTLGNTVLLLIVIALLVAGAALFSMPLILNFISTPAELWDDTELFLRIICVGFVFQSLGMGVNNFLRTAGKPNLAFITQLIGTVLCVVFNYIFVLQMGWGIAGSAYATLLGMGIGMIPTMSYFMFVKSAPFRLRLKMMSPNFRLCGRILVMGLASFFMQVGAMCVSLVFNMVVGKYCVIDGVHPDTALAAIGIAQKAVMFGFMPMIGLLMGVQPIIGFNFGAKLWHRVLEALKISIIAAMVVGGIYTLLAHVFPEQLVSVFGIKGDSKGMAAQALMTYSLFLCPVGFQIIGSSYFQSSGQPIKSSILELTRQVIILVPLYLLFPPVAMALFGWTGLDSVVACVPISDALSICVTTCFVVYEIRKLRKWRDEAQAAQAAESMERAESVEGAGNTDNAESAAVSA